MPAEPVLELTGLSRRFRSGSQTVAVLERLDLVVAPGERVAIMGASGSGKSTLLHLAAGMDVPDAGRVRLHGRELSSLREPERTQFRGANTGLVFQDFNLIDSLDVGENIDLPLWLNGIDRNRSEVAALTRELGIADKLRRLPDELSGGEKQRVAIARALVHQPSLLLADEPTGSLDQDTAGVVLQLFDQVARRRRCALVLATHNPDAAGICDRTLWLRHGRLHPD
ncbi:MAG: ABC transporter ATP-binding protein [Wenzhouxiangella sp.]